MTCQIRYHPDARDRDLPKINQNLQKPVKTAIEHRLLAAPDRYSEPLKRTLKGYCKLRVGDY